MNCIKYKLTKMLLDYNSVLYYLTIDYNFRPKLRFDIQVEINEKIRKSYFNSLSLH
jgi:hypothetical protein